MVGGFEAAFFVMEVSCKLGKVVWKKEVEVGNSSFFHNLRLDHFPQLI